MPAQDLAQLLAQRTLELVNIPSESLAEEAVRAHVRALVPQGWSPSYVGEDAAFWIPQRRPGVPLVVLAGHYDTVPAQENLPGRVDDGWVEGLGSADMKGGVAVALEIVRALAERPEPASLDVGLLLFGKEELPPAYNPLPELFENCVALRDAELAILLEPTSGTVHAGCVGTLNARVTFSGTSGHAARPWLADNALERAIVGLAKVAAHERQPTVVGGLEFFETVTVTRLESGIADNVVPDRATAVINLRYPPNRTPGEAIEFLAGLLPAEAELDVFGNSPPARVVADTALVHRLLASGARGVEPKQAWTNVADFTTRGIDAINFGPGEPRYAHRRDERVEIVALVHCYETLWRFVGGDGHTENSEAGTGGRGVTAAGPGAGVDGSGG